MAAANPRSNCSSKRIPEVGAGAAGHTLADELSRGGDEEDEHSDHDHEASATSTGFAYFAVAHRCHAFVHSTPLLSGHFLLLAI